jgi:hypothetical protein
MKDQMSCCCCVPLGMAYHIIACFEIIFMTFLIVQSLEYYYAAEDGEKAKAHHIIKLFYNWIFYMLVASISVYSVPRIFVYLFTICRSKSYSRLQLYFTTRIITFLLLALIHITMFVVLF